MKENKFFDKFSFFVPFIIMISYILFQLNINFKINGGFYAFLGRDAIMLFFVYFLVLISFYFIFRKIIKNKKILYLTEIVLVFSFRTYSIFIVLGLLIFGFLYKNNNRNINAFFDVSLILLSFISVFFCIFNLTGAYKCLSFNIRNKDFNKNISIKVEDDKSHPNIYWIHMDGMPNIDFIKKYYKNDLDDFTKYLDSYYVNEKASFKGGHNTITALNALFNPYYYDNFLKDYYNDLDRCELNRCETKMTISFKDLVYRRMDNELFKSLDKAGYSTITISEFNSYTSFNSDYVYDLNGINRDGVPFYKNNLSDDEIYGCILEDHRNYILDRLVGIKIKNKDISERRISCDINTKYNYLNTTDYTYMKAMVSSIDDSRKLDNNPKFYFLDNPITHIEWVYDENGNKIGDNITDLSNFDNNYVYTTKLLMEFTSYIKDNDENAVIIIQGDHGIHYLDSNIMKKYYNINDKEVLNIRNSTINAVYIPDEYKNGDEDKLSNPLNISRYIINNFVGKNYEYIK